MTIEQLREEIRASDEETRTLMRVLHEEVIKRFKRLEDSWRPPRRKRQRARSSGPLSGKAVG